LAKLDTELVNAKRELSTANEEYEGARPDHCYFGSIERNPEYFAAQRNKTSAESKVSRLRKSIHALEVQPPNVEMGLPKSKEIAFQWLFFLFMPPEFQQLCTMMHGSQKLLTNKTVAETSSMSLHAWFKSRKKSTSKPLSIQPAKILCTRSSEPRIGRPGIRSYVRETDIFFPDSLLLDPVWRDGDPFACFLDHDSTQIFTELLPSHIEGSAALQKFIPMLPSGTREKEAVAFQTDRPDWMSSDNFSAFAGLRAHPHTQFRSFVDAISLDRLPFDNPCVHVLIKQAMFHFGHESWKTDTTSKWNGLNVLFHELQ
jgi:hypothetical protein